MPFRRLMMPAALRGLMYFCFSVLPLTLLAEEIVGRRTPPREVAGSERSESLCTGKIREKLGKTWETFKLTAWFNIPTDTLRIPMPDVDDFPTEDALRFGRFRVVFLSFGDLDDGDWPLLLKPSEMEAKISLSFQ